MKASELKKMGVPGGPPITEAFQAIKAAALSGVKKARIKNTLRLLAKEPSAYVDDPCFGALAQSILDLGEARSGYVERETPAPWKQWGTDLEAGAVEQMRHACDLPVAVAGALMPDAHQGYGLPIGGVLATRNCVIPYAVGVDIACRMKMTVLDMPPGSLDTHEARLEKAIEQETRFGIGASFQDKREHAVMDRDWSITKPTRENKDKAWSQLGSSGSGNHFVEFGTFTLSEPDLGLDAGTYLALLSHSGSRGVGAAVANHFCRLAREGLPHLPKQLKHLAWLDLDSEEGEAYWLAMELMGEYAAANHALIHEHIARNLGVEVLLDVENHHNFAWKETHFGESLVVHRKGATPAGEGVLGIIPGSMGTAGYVVRGAGMPESLNSASHGAGRKMSRTAAKKQFSWTEVERFLQERKVRLISAGLDEVPMAYKDIDQVMAAQQDLVTVAGRFDPRLVKMAPPGERPED